MTITSRINSVILIASTMLLPLFCLAENVTLETDLGTIEIELFNKEAPQSCANFLDYVDSHFYNGTIFHRVIPNFMAQAGGLRYDFSKKETKDPVVNESHNGLRNLKGTVAMARFTNPDSATSQFFINLVDNPHLDPRKTTAGYTVFGRVISGMGVVTAIAAEPQGKLRAYPNAPNTPIRILKAYRSTESVDK